MRRVSNKITSRISMPQRADVAQIDFLPWHVSRRARRISKAFCPRGRRIAYFALERAGRSGARDRFPGHYYEQGVEVRHTHVREPLDASGIGPSSYNLLAVYLPALLRLSLRVLLQPADVIVAHNPIFLPVAALHRAIWRSYILFNARERPCSVRTGGSLASWFRPIEGLVLRRVAPSTELVIATCESHASLYTQLGFAHVVVARNVPDTEDIYVPEYRPAQCAPLFKVGFVGRISPGRGLEQLIDALALTEADHVVLEITGYGSAAYENELGLRARRRGVADRITWRGYCQPQHGIARITQVDVTAVLFDPADPVNQLLPNKFFDALAAGRCVLAAGPYEVGRLIEQLQCGRFTTFDPQALATEIDWLADNPDYVQEAGHKAYMASKDLVWEVEANKLTNSIARFLPVRRTDVNAS